MVDITPLEQAALRACLPSFGAVAGAIGFDKPLGDYTEDEALTVIEVIVTAFAEQMTVQHEHSKFPPVRMPGTTPVTDPIRHAISQEAH